MQKFVVWFLKGLMKMKIHEKKLENMFFITFICLCALATIFWSIL